MYQKAGFQTIIENETDFIMVCDLQTEGIDYFS
jgi:hypothetical protein